MDEQTGRHVQHSVRSSAERCRRETSRTFKGKVVSVIFLTEHHAMKAYWGVDV
jgi:hypothetical protein